jgi:hypothetical protein
MPRTQTNDLSIGVSPNAHRFWSTSLAVGTTTLYTVSRANVNAVITSMDICNTSGGGSDQCAIQCPTSGAYIFGGQTGAGIFDTFSWRGLLVLYPGEAIRAVGATGVWYSVGSGYYQPFIEHSV